MVLCWVIMRKAKINKSGKLAGILFEQVYMKEYVFSYDADYSGLPVSLTMPVCQEDYVFDSFPPFLDGVLPEGLILESFLKREKLDKQDYFSQLIVLGQDLVGDLIVEPLEDE